MSLNKRQRLAAFLAAYVLIVWLVWNKLQILSLTCVLMALAIPCLGILHAPLEAPLSPATKKFASGRLSQFLFGLAGLVLAWQASRSGLNGEMLPMAGWMLGAALAFRLTTLEPLPAPKARTLARLALGVVLLGALFRLWRAGAVPVGECGTDETAIWATARDFLSGIRMTYTDTGDGVIPIYMLMAGIKAFGSSILGWRLEGILCGIALTALFYRLGKDSLGAWVGLGAAFFWGVDVWPVTITRAAYYMSESALLVMACLALLTLALKKGGAWRFVAAGLFWSFCLNAYPAARLMLGLVPWLYALLWFLERDARPALKRSTGPLLSGFLVGGAPLALWLWLSYPESVRKYFVEFTSWQSGPLASPSLLGKMDEAFSRIFHAFPTTWEILTRQATWTVSDLFPAQYPLLHPWLFALAVLGACAALARFRNAFCSFLLYWWFAGLLPGLAAGECNDRRLMMVLPPTLLLAALGTETLAQVARALLGKTKVAVLILAAAGIAGASAYGLASWRDYFDRNQRDTALLSIGLAQYIELGRGLYADMNGGGVLISTLRDDDGSFYGGMFDDRVNYPFTVMLPNTPVFRYQKDPYTYDSGGVLEALQWALNKAPAKGPNPVYILLMPFYDYLAPGLEDIGATQVAEFPHVLSSRGTLIIGRDSDPTHFARLFLIKDLDRTEVARYAQRPVFEEECRELQPPRGWTRDKVRALNVSDPAYEPLVRSYEQGDWSRGKTADWNTDDPWFWAASEYLPGGLTVPYSFTMKAELSVPKDGNYSFGASATIWTRIKVDGKTVFLRDPYTPAAVKGRSKLLGDGDLNGITWRPDVQERRGFLGPSVRLTRGTHTLEIDQAFLSHVPNFAHVLRPLWQAPGQKMETLPLELLREPSGPAFAR